jgi:hypothetical protein
MENENFENYLVRIFNSYESNSNNFQKIFGILLGLGLFFLLTVIFPYFINIYEQNEKKVEIEKESNFINQ